MPTHGQAAQLLAESDPVRARLVDQAGPPDFPKPTETHFATLVRAITLQQLAGAAARTIHGRLVAAPEDEVTPERMLGLSTEAMRAARLSANKAASMRDPRPEVLDGTVVLNPRGLARESDEEVIIRLDADTEELDALGEPYRPYRSIVAWYCWRAAEFGAHQRSGRATSIVPL